MANRTLGRPPLPRDKTRSHRVVTFATEAELARLEYLADRQDMALSATVHQIISKELENQTKLINGE